jgi:3-methyladenine DNA glycosylase Tag
MEAPQQITPTKLADYLEVLTKAVFESGMSWRIIEAKWPGFLEAFSGFDPETVASLNPDEVDALTSDTRIIRNRRKIEATLHNAATMIELDREFGGFKNYLRSTGGFWPQVADMRKRFKHVGDFGAFYFLYVVGEPVPEHHEFRAKLLEGGSKAATGA